MASTGIFIAAAVLLVILLLIIGGLSLSAADYIYKAHDFTKNKALQEARQLAMGVGMFSFMGLIMFLIVTFTVVYIGGVSTTDVTDHLSNNRKVELGLGTKDVSGRMQNVMFIVLGITLTVCIGTGIAAAVGASRIEKHIGKNDDLKAAHNRMTGGAVIGLLGSLVTVGSMFAYHYSVSSIVFPGNKKECVPDCAPMVIYRPPPPSGPAPRLPPRMSAPRLPPRMSAPRLPRTASVAPQSSPFDTYPPPDSPPSVFYDTKETQQLTQNTPNSPSRSVGHPSPSFPEQRSNWSLW